jgi:hypothetical protein
MRWSAAPLLSATLALAVFPSCSGKTTQAAGLEVIVTSSDLTAPADFDTIEVVVQQEASPGGRWNTIIDIPRRVPDELKLPARVPVQTGTSPDQDARIFVTASKAGVPLVERGAQVQLPADRVAELVIVLSQLCSGKVTTCTNGSCEPDSGNCGASIIVNPSTLPTYVPGEVNLVDSGSGGDATASGSASSGGGDATTGSGSGSGSSGASSGGSDASASSGGQDSAVSSSSSGLDATSSTGSASSSGSGNAEGGSSDGGDAASQCSPGQTQCSGSNVESCQSSGQWAVVTTCTTSVPNATATCSGAVCGHACNSGYNACSSSSCVSSSSLGSCGACGNACDTATGTPSCNGSTCSYTCNAGHVDCNASTAPDLDGCECATPSCCGQACQVSHSDGTGQSWFDCNPLGTYTMTQAMSACVAKFGTSGGCQSGWTCGTGATKVSQPTVCDMACTTCWAYGTATGMYPVTVGTLTNCTCPGTQIGSWQ